MGRVAKTGLSKHDTKGYRLSVGKKPDGGYRTFWLGHDRAVAEYHANMLRERFIFMRAQGREVWTPEDEDAVREFVDFFKLGMTKLRQQHERDVLEVQQKGNLLDAVFGQPAAPASAQQTASPAAAGKQSTLYDAIKVYLAALDGKRMSESHRWRARQILETTLKGIRKDCPLADIDYLWLDKLCDYFKARPKVDKTGKPMRPQTVVTTLRYLRAFFNWIDDTGFGGWQGPRKLLRPFRARTTDLMTPAEVRASTTIEQFDITTLVKLYRAGSDRQKVWMLTALFTAGTQTELSVLEKSEFDLKAGALVHHRNKTLIEGRFWLPPELVKLLRSEFRGHRHKPLAFYTEEGSPLVSFKDSKKMSDAVRLSWDRLRDKAEVPDALSFKYLRKFAADYATRHGGETMGQIALSHARQSVLAKSYTARDFEQFNELQRKMHAEFVAAEMFEKAPAKQKAVSERVAA
jgi:hypothetical protein